jgi:putative nucleotidyltransferase with HDIG domain
MQKRISVDQLRPGMYIHDLNAGWIGHPFLRNRFALEHEEQIIKIREAGIRELYIDTARGIDAADAATQLEVKADIERSMQEIATRAPKPVKISLSEEIGRARSVQTEARRVVKGMMNDIRLGGQLELEAMEPLVEKMTESILRNSGALLSLGQLKSVDDYTFEHSVSVCALMIAFARSMGLEPASIREAGLGALLHDVGKAYTPLEILNKPGRFTDEEFAIMKQHPVDGHKILKQHESLGEVPLAIALQHHERMDGSGYPDKRRGDEIAFFAQMAAIVDVYDAISSDRVYHKGMPPAEAVRKIFEWSRHHFNPALVQVFVRSVGIYPVGALVSLESQKLAWVTEVNPDNLVKPRVKVFYDTKRRGYVAPFEVDLAKPVGYGGADRIASFEDPAIWGIKMERSR